MSYYSDHRVITLEPKWYDSFDEKRMLVSVTIGDKEYELPCIYSVCPTCDGKGSHVNPSIDADGLTAEDFAEDPEFAESYFRGAYDMPCNECKGRRVVPDLDRDNIDKTLLEQFDKEQAIIAQELYYDRIARERGY